MANHPHDNLRMLELTRRSKVPTIGMCMGDIGTPTRILAGKFGAPFTYATFHHERALAPGQLSYQQMTEIYHYDQINAETEVYGVIADPVGHSLSPQIHNAAFRQCKLNKVYIPSACRARTSRGLSTTRPALDIKGLSVTIPHKEDVVKKLDRGRRRRPRHRRRQHHRLRGQEAAGLQHRLSGGDGQPGSGRRRSARSSSRAEGQDGAGPRRRRRRQGHRLRPDAPRGSTWWSADGVARQAQLLAQRFECRSVEWAARHTVVARLADQLHAGRHAPERGRNALREAPPAAVDDRLRRGLQPREHAVGQRRPQPQLHGRHRRRHVRPPGCLQFELFTGQEGPAELMRETIRRAIGAAKY